MRNRKFAVCVLSLVIALGLQAGAKSATKTNGAPDKAHLQKIWDGWSTLNPANVAQFYASGPHTFFDIAPLKYSSWDEYQSGVVKVVADLAPACKPSAITRDKTQTANLRFLISSSSRAAKFSHDSDRRAPIIRLGGRRELMPSFSSTMCSCRRTKSASQKRSKPRVELPS